MLSTIMQAILTIFYCVLGLVVAFPLSYFFQSDLYAQMSWWQYVSGGRNSLFAGAQFGSLDIYRYTAVGCVLAVIGIGKTIESRLKRQ